MSAPGTVVFIKVDTLGDLVLFAPALSSLRTAWPSARVAVVIRQAYIELAPLLAPDVEWLPTTLDPFNRSPDADPAELGRLRTAVAALQPATIAAATSRRNWLEIALAATHPAARRIALGAAAQDEFFDTQLRVQLGLDSATAFQETIATAPDEPDWRKNFLLVDTLVGQPVARTSPSLSVPETTGRVADGILARHHLERGRYVVCAAAGFANVRLKTWPTDRFAAAIAHLRDQHGLPTLLVGAEHERAHLESVTGASAVWLGGERDLPILAALVAHAALYFGNDTGAMHLAAALDVPVAAIFGGGTWPRFVPAARRGIALVHPLPCFGCGWDCAFGDAPCLGQITVDDAKITLDAALTATDFVVRQVDHVAVETRAFLATAATRYRESRAGHLARQHKLEELTALDREKDQAIAAKEAEIAALKTVCDEREKTIFILDGHVKYFQAENGTLKADKAVLDKTFAALPADAAKAARTIADQVVHIRNIESLLQQREAEIAEQKSALANRAAGLHELEQAKHYGRLLAEKEAVIRGLARGESLLQRWRRALEDWLFRRVVEDYWMQIGVLRHYGPRPLQWDSIPKPSRPVATLPQVAIVTPSYGQEKFIERTLRSVLDQAYPKLIYAVQDGGSKDRSAEIIARYADRLRHWESVPDKGQADAVRRGFTHLIATLGPGDLMAWLNSDDLLAPGALAFVAEYFASHPDVDVIYGHRIIIDDDDRDVGRWIMPPHRPESLEWIDYVPQETMFWRKRAWDLTGGIDPSFQFALDWDLLARFHQAGLRMVRLPYFLGAFRVHAEQKTSQAIHTTGAEEMRRIRTRFHGERQDDFETINRHARATRFRGAITARLHALGIRA